LGTFLDKLKIGLLPEHVLRGTSAAQIADHPFNLTPIGTGPYQLEALRAADGVHINVVDLRVAPVYRQRAEAQDRAFAVERLRFRLYDDFESALGALVSGEVDGLAGIDRDQRRTLFEVANNNDLPMYNTLEPTLGVLIFNWAQSDSRFFREQRVRVALEVGLDRASAIERTLSNRAVLAQSPIMPNTWAYLADLPWPGYNPEQGRSLLTTAVERLEQLAERANEDEVAEGDTEAAEVTAAPGIPALASFSILTPDEPALVSLTQEIAAQWTQLGLSVTVITAAPERYWQQLDSGAFDVALIELSQGESADPDIYSFWHQGQYPDGENYGGVDDRRISELLERARRDPYGINRVSDYHELQRVFVERAIAIPLYYPLYTYVTSDRVEGIQLGFVGQSSDRFRNIGDWRVQ
jgi:ABC-type transport system substrate-binding protein